MPDSTNVTRLQEGLSSLLDLVQTALNQKEVPDTLRHRVLGGIVAVEALTEICADFASFSDGRLGSR